MLRDRIRTRWQVFAYNFAWPDYVWLLDSWLARAALAVPIVGYLILFNDTISDHLRFDNLVGATSVEGFIPGVWRLRLVYFGMVLLGAASLLYRATRPYVMRIGSDEIKYVRAMLEHADVSAYIQLHGQIRDGGMDPYTRHGKFYDSEWDGFLEAAIGRRVDEPRARDTSEAHWVEAKSKYESLLRGILLETYFRETISRRFWLSTCILIGFSGLGLLLLPSADLFVRVLKVVFFGATGGAMSS